MLERTDTEWGPWTIVEATDRCWARVKIFQTIIRRMEEALQDRGFELPEQEPEPDEEEEPAPEAPAGDAVELVTGESADTKAPAQAQAQAAAE
jgi:hypothetical protein